MFHPASRPRSLAVILIALAVIAFLFLRTVRQVVSTPERGPDTKQTAAPPPQARALPETRPAIVPPPLAAPPIDTRSPLAKLVGDTPGRLVVLFVDVGQGDGLILKLPNGSFVVVDANQGQGDRMADILEELGCRTILAMVMSHPHADHIGGLPEILKRFRVENFYDPGVPYPSSIYKRVLLAVEEEGCNYIIPKPGDILTWDPRVAITVVGGGTIMADDVNNASIVLHMVLDSASILLTGDAEKESEDSMVARFAGRLRSTILKVGHHGSFSSSKPHFLKELGAQYGVISVGRDNVYKLPKEGTLQFLREAGIRIFRTDEEGTILATTTGQIWSIGPVGEADPVRPSGRWKSYR